MPLALRFGRRDDPRMAPPRRRHLVLILLITVGLVLGSVPASASNYGPPYRDNNAHYYYFVSLESYTTTAANWGKDRVEDGGSVTSHADPSCKTQTDVCVYDADYTGSAWATVYGKSDCVKYGNPTTLCDQFRIRYDTSNLSGYSTTYLRRAGCHEFGHTLRLEHFDSIGGSYSCMYSSISNALQSTYYSTHDKTHF